MNTIDVKINGENVKICKDSTLQDLVNDRGLKGFFAIEQNLNIINKEDYENCIIKEGDNIEIVSFTGGG